MKSAGYVIFLITSKVLDARRRGATTEAYGAIGQGGAIEGNVASNTLMVDHGGLISLTMNGGISYNFT